MLAFKRKRTRARVVLIASALIFLLGAPLAAAVFRPHQPTPAPSPDTVALYASGLSTLGSAALISLPLALVFAFTLFASERRHVKRRILNQNGRNRQNAINSGRMLLVILGSAAAIVGLLSGAYATLGAMRPDLAILHVVPLGFGVAIPCTVLGILSYAAGQIGRRPNTY